MYKKHSKIVLLLCITNILFNHTYPAQQPKISGNKNMTFTICSVCNRSFHGNQGFAIHFARAHKKPVNDKAPVRKKIKTCFYSCPQCNTSFVQRYWLDEHIQKHHTILIQKPAPVDHFQHNVELNKSLLIKALDKKEKKISCQQSSSDELLNEWLEML